MIVNPKISWSYLEDKIVIMNPKEETNYVLNETSALIFEKLHEGLSVKELKQYLVSIYGAENTEVIYSDTDKLINEMIEIGLLITQ